MAKNKGNDWSEEIVYGCRKCGVGNLCDVCHEHSLPRGDCDVCPQVPEIEEDE